MCDTFVINRENKKYFLKNSDRSPNEINIPVFYPRQEHSEKLVECTYISIPQVSKTNAVFLIKPTWIWGAEMGVNEYGVCIGNEAVFTNKGYSKTPSLIGMDFLRLALERANSAKEALFIITSLLEKYGQGGNCGYDHKFYYDNSYLISDNKETYVLETVGRNYAYRKVETYNISNKLSLTDDYDFATKKYKNFAKENSDLLFTKFSCSKTRECDGKELINKTDLDIKSMISILSHHNKTTSIEKGDVGSICMHKNALGDHSTGSFIVDMNYENPTIWIGGNTPCISIYKPYIFGKGSFINDIENQMYKYAFSQSMLSRCVLGGVINYDQFKERIDEINYCLISKEKELRKQNDIDGIIKLSDEAFKMEKDLIKEYSILSASVLKGETSLEGIWDKLTKNISNNPFSRDLSQRLK